MKDKKVVIGVVIAIVAVVGIALAVTLGNANKDNNPTSQQVEEKIMTEKPVFMYFISESDEKHADTKAILDELQSAYSNKVTFNIINVDEKPEAVEQYSLNVLNQTGKATPTLIMLDTKGNFKSIKGGFADKTVLEDAIKSALE